MEKENITGQPFDFQSWREWLRERAEKLQKAGVRINFHFNDIGSKPSSGFTIENDTHAGYFSNWATGETDFEILDKKRAQVIVSRSGLISEDSTFVNIFEEFMTSLRF